MILLAPPDWIHCPRPPHHTTARLFCFPWGGSDAFLFGSFAHVLPDALLQVFFCPQPNTARDSPRNIRGGTDDTHASPLDLLAWWLPPRRMFQVQQGAGDCSFLFNARPPVGAWLLCSLPRLMCDRTDCLKGGLQPETRTEPLSCRWQDRQEECVS